MTPVLPKEPNPFYDHPLNTPIKKRRHTKLKKGFIYLSGLLLILSLSLVNARFMPGQFVKENTNDTISTSVGGASQSEYVLDKVGLAKSISSIKNYYMKHGRFMPGAYTKNPGQLGTIKIEAVTPRCGKRMLPEHAEFCKKVYAGRKR